MDKSETAEYAAQLLDHPPKTIIDLGIHLGVDKLKIFDIVITI